MQPLTAGLEGEMAYEVQLTPGLTGTDERASGLRVDLLGPLQVECAGQTLHVAGIQRRRLLALLAIRAGQVVPVEAIVDAMWGQDPPPSATKTVQSHIVRLRQSLATAGDPIVTLPGGYRLDADPSLNDVARFEVLATEGSAELRAGHFAAAVNRFEAAVALWRGPVLLEFADQDFAVGERVRLEERRLVALEDLAEARLGTGAAPSVAAEMERVVTEQPGRERAWALLMRALYASGRQHDALGAYQRARAVLGEEFGLEPGRDLVDLERRIVAQDRSLLGPASRASLPAALRSDAPFIGRRDELAWLRAAWSLACTGVGQVRAVLGERGSGRTRLVAELAAMVGTDGGSVEHVAGSTGLHLLGPGAEPGSIIDTVADRCRVEPLLLIVDDVEWSPPESINAIRALAAAAQRMMVFVVLIGDHVDGPGIQLIRELESSCASTLDLAPMSDDEIAGVIGEGVEPDAIEAAVALAGGLPGVARREAAAWAERAATERLNTAATISVGARSAAAVAGASVLDEVRRLVAARGRRAALVGAEWPGRQPYRSLASYGPADADLFVGRERLVAELTARVLDRRLVAVVGASGSGKSSIVHAGLIPLVRSGHLPGGGPWRASVIVPGHDPLVTIETVAGLDEPGPQLLVIDQFEELLAADDLDDVAAQVLDLVLDPALDAHVVLVVRADQVGALASSRALAQLIEDAQVLVGPPSDEELRRIIVEPARRTGCTVEPELVSMVAADVAGHDAALPLVSAAMAEVWEQRSGDTLQAATYVEIGGLAAAVERLGDRAVDAVGAERIGLLREAMLRLVDVTDDGAWVRRRIAAADLPSGMWPAIDALVDARLVSHSSGEIDVVHEVVFRAWPQMVSWLEEARADLTLERDLRAAARTWDAQGRSDDDVLRGGRLHAANDWATRRDDVPPPIMELLAASGDWAERDDRAIRDQLARERRSRRRLRFALVAASLLLVIALVGGALAVANSRRATAQRRRADTAASQAAAAAEVAEQRRATAQTDRLVAESRGNLDRDLGLSMLLAVEARRSADTPQTRGALLSTLVHDVSTQHAAQQSCCAPSTVRHTKSSFRGFVAGPARVTYSLSLSSDGRIAATGGESEESFGSGSALIFDTAKRTMIGRVPTVSRTPRVDVNADGMLVLVTDDDKLFLFDTASATTRQLTVAPEANATFVRAFFTLDGSRFIVNSSNHHLWMFDATTLTRIAMHLPDSPHNVTGLVHDGTIAFDTTASSPSVTFWDPDGLRATRQVKLAQPTPLLPNLFTFSADMTTLAGGSLDGIVLWDLSDGHLVGDSARRPKLARAIAFDPSDRSILAVGSADGGVVMYDVAAEQPIGEPLRGQVGGIRALSFSRDGQLLATIADDGSLGLWADNGDESLLSSPLPADGTLLAASPDGRTAVFGTSTSAAIRELTDLAGSAHQVDLVQLLHRGSPPLEPYPWSVSADGSTVSGGLSIGTSTFVWTVDAASGQVRWSNAPRGGEVTFAGMNADGSRIAFVTNAQHRIDVWNTEANDGFASLSLEQVFPGSGTFFTGPPTFSRDGQRIAVATSAYALVEFDLATSTWSVGKPARFVQGQVSYAPDDHEIIGGGAGGVVWRWDTTSGEITGSGQSSDPSSIAGVLSSADGAIMAALHPFSSSVALFDATTLTSIGDPIPTGDVTYSAPALSPDGKRLYANDLFGKPAQWDLDPDSWQRIACHAAGRNLTRAEFAEYLGADATYRATCPEWPLAAV